MNVTPAEFSHTKIHLPVPQKLSNMIPDYCNCLPAMYQEEQKSISCSLNENQFYSYSSHTLDNCTYCVCTLSEKFSNLKEVNSFYSSTIDPVVCSQNATIKPDVIDTRKCNSNLNYVDDCESSDEDLQQALNQKNSQFDSFIFKPKKGESEEETIERLKTLLKINYNIDVPNDSFEIYFQKCNETNRKRRMLRCNYEGCSKSFKKAWNLFDHMRIHTGDKPFLCRVCGRGFAQNGNLTKHIKLHTSENRKVHSCEICGRKYTERFNLRVHMKKHRK